MSTDTIAEGTVEPRSFNREPTWERKGTLIGVDERQRHIELVVIPYGEETVVGYNGRPCREVIERGAFDGIENRPGRVKANRSHDERLTFGRALSFHPSRDEGLVAVIKVARTALGDETLELVDDGCLDASAGFVPMDGGMQWMQRSAYRITKGYLRHIALVPEAQYAGARVLSVRSAEHVSGTPNLDQVRAWRDEDRLRALDASR